MSPEHQMVYQQHTTKLNAIQINVAHQQTIRYLAVFAQETAQDMHLEHITAVVAF